MVITTSRSAQPAWPLAYLGFLLGVITPPFAGFVLGRFELAAGVSLDDLFSSPWVGAVLTAGAMVAVAVAAGLRRERLSRFMCGLAAAAVAWAGLIEFLLTLT